MKEKTANISPELLNKALAAAVDGIVISEASGRDFNIIYTNPAFETMTGYSQEEVLGKDCRFLNQNARDQEAIEVIRNSLKAHKPCRVILLNHKKSGESFWNELSLSPVFSKDNELTHYIGVQKDVTERVYNRQKIEEIAMRDDLTNLPNRRYFNQGIEQLWGVHQRLETSLAFAFIDIDDFKKYNDNYGHLEGDKTLQAVAQKVSDQFSRSGDLVARFGGEEFIIVTTLESGPENFINGLEKLRKSILNLEIEHKYSNASPYISVSIGVYFGVPRVDDSPMDFIELADEAMYQAKLNGKNQIHVSNKT